MYNRSSRSALRIYFLTVPSVVNATYRHSSRRNNFSKSLYGIPLKKSYAFPSVALPWRRCLSIFAVIFRAILNEQANRRVFIIEIFVVCLAEMHVPRCLLLFCISASQQFLLSCIAPDPKVLDAYSTISVSQSSIFNTIVSKKKSDF